jgi:hypothetical protein
MSGCNFSAYRIKKNAETDVPYFKKQVEVQVE